MSIISAGEGKCRAEMTVTENEVNAHGILHGSMTASLVDIISTYAVMTQGTGAPGVSLGLNVQ